MTATAPGSGDGSGRENRGSRRRANLTLNKALTQTHTIEEVLQYVDAHGEEFNFVNAATAMHRLGVQAKRGRQGGRLTR